MAGRCLAAVAVRALVLDDAGVAADRVAVDRMVDGKVSHIRVVHGADDGLERLDVLRRVAVHLDVGDVARVLEGVIRRLDADFIDGADWIVDRHMARVRHVVAVGDAFDDAILFTVRALELTGGRLRGRCKAAPVHVLALHVVIHALAQVADDFKTQFLRLGALAVVLAD